MGIRDKIPRLRSGAGTKKLQNEFEDDLEDVDTPEEAMEVEKSGRKGQENQMEMSPKRYRDEISRIVNRHLVETYHAGKAEGLLEANNDDKHFKLTMISAGATFINLAAILFIARHMGIF